MRPASRPDGREIYEYVMLYVDNILAIADDAKKILESLQGGTNVRRVR